MNARLSEVLMSVRGQTLTLPRRTLFLDAVLVRTAVAW
jgi:hypothetical protein